MENYRPISLLSSMSKMFEKVVYKQLIIYFQKNRLLYNGQYGFRINHSTELAAIELVDRILKDIDNKKLPLAIYIWIYPKRLIRLITISWSRNFNIMA